MGKGVESAFLRSVLDRLKGMGIGKVTSTYFPTAKNIQVADFYDREGFSLVATNNDGSKTYRMDLSQRIPVVEPLFSIEYND